MRTTAHQHRFRHLLHPWPTTTGILSSRGAFPKAIEFTRVREEPKTSPKNPPKKNNQITLLRQERTGKKIQEPFLETRIYISNFLLPQTYRIGWANGYNVRCIFKQYPQQQRPSQILTLSVIRFGKPRQRSAVLSQCLCRIPSPKDSALVAAAALRASWSFRNIEVSDEVGLKRRIRLLDCRDSLYRAIYP